MSSGGESGKDDRIGRHWNSFLQAVFPHHREDTILIPLRLNSAPFQTFRPDTRMHGWSERLPLGDL